MRCMYYAICRIYCMSRGILLVIIVIKANELSFFFLGKFTLLFSYLQIATALDSKILYVLFWVGPFQVGFPQPPSRPCLGFTRGKHRNSRDREMKTWGRTTIPLFQLPNGTLNIRQSKEIICCPYFDLQDFQAHE